MRSCQITALWDVVLLLFLVTVLRPQGAFQVTIWIVLVVFFYGHYVARTMLDIYTKWKGR
jgi:hypothetical protein